MLRVNISFYFNLSMSKLATLFRIYELSIIAVTLTDNVIKSHSQCRKFVTMIGRHFDHQFNLYFMILHDFLFQTVVLNEF